MQRHHRASVGIAPALALCLAACAAAATQAPSPASTATPSLAPTTPPGSTAAPTPVVEQLHVVIDAIKFDAQGDTATAMGRGLGSGTLRALLIVDDSDPGPNKDCNTVSEDGVFTFKTGTISYRSWHRDCNFGGPRIQTIFAVTGGTGAFDGATGWGTERDDAPDGFAFDGRITHR